MMTAKPNKVLNSGRVPHNCPTCVSGRAVRSLSAAMEAWIEHDTVMEGDLYYLRDEVEASIKSWRGVLVRRRLRKALDTTVGHGLPEVHDEMLPEDVPLT